MGDNSTTRISLGSVFTDLEGYRIDVHALDRVVLTLLFRDGSAIRFGDRDADVLAQAASDFRAQRDERQAATEDYAHSLNKWLDAASGDWPLGKVRG